MCATARGQAFFNIADPFRAAENSPGEIADRFRNESEAQMDDSQPPLYSSDWYGPRHELTGPFEETEYPWYFSGRGHRLVGTSWLNRPYHFDAFVGGLYGDVAIDPQVELGGAVLSGVRLGWDFTDYWGTDLRLAIGDANLVRQSGKGEVQFFDVHLNWYPWGDKYVRPFASVGSGLGRFSYLDAQGQAVTQVLYQLPVGIGVKCYFRRWLSLRLELMDNIAFGAGQLNTMHNLSLTGGVEVRFGGPRTSYFPFESTLLPR